MTNNEVKQHASGFAFSEVVRKLANLIRIGKIAEIDGAQVRVQIGRVTTGFLPIISYASEDSFWWPISKGEQVAVFAPFGEFAQGFVLRSIHYNVFPAQSDQNSINVKAKNDVKVSGEKKCDITFNDGFEIKVGNASLKMSDSKISINCGSSSIDISEDSISMKAVSITTMPKLCLCQGGL